jgi:hypothetical protein
MKLIRKAGATGQIFQVFVRDSSSSTGAGLSGLTNASSGLVAAYHRDTDTTATSISLVSMTVGTFTSGGFAEIDSVKMPGWYQFCPPNAALGTGASSAGFHLQGATNMTPTPIEVDLDAQVDVANVGGVPVVAAGGVFNAIRSGTAQAGTSGSITLDSGASAVTNLYVDLEVQVLSGTGAGQVRLVTGYNGSTKIATVVPNWITTPDSTSVFALLPSAQVDLGAVNGSAVVPGVVDANVTEVGGTAVVAAGGVLNGIRTGTAQAGGANTITLDSGASVTNNLYANEIVYIASGTGAGQVNTIASYVGSTRVATMISNWAVNPDSTSVFLILPAGPVAASISGGVNVTQWGGVSVPALVNGWVPSVTPIRSGTAQAGGTNMITLDSGASATNNLYNSAIVYIASGTGAGQVNTVSAYAGSTKVATVIDNWAVNPDSTSVFVILPAGPVSATVSGGVNVTQWNGSAVATPNVAGVPIVDLGYTRGTVSAGAPGYTGPDWGHINAPSSTVALSGTTLGTVTTLTNLPAAPNNWLTAAAVAAAALVGKGDWLTASAVPVNFGALLIDSSGRVVLAPAGFDSVLVETGIGASTSLVNDAGTQLTAINGRQALAVSLSALSGLVSGATAGSSATVSIKPGGNGSGNTRITASTDQNGNRTAVTMKVPT